MHVSKHAISELERERRESRRRSVGYAAAALPVLTLLAAHAVSSRAALMALACAAAGSLWWLHRSAAAHANERAMLDELVVHDWRNVAPEEYERRVQELRSPRLRRSLARALEQYSAMPRMPVCVAGLRPDVARNRDRIARVAERLRDARQPVDPRGVVLATRMVTDVASPFFHGDVDGLARELERVERALELETPEDPPLAAAA